MKNKETDLIISSLFAMLMLTIINLYILLTVIPGQARFYSSSMITLPSLTVIYISISHFVWKWMLFIFPLIFVGFTICAILGFVLAKKSILVKIYIAMASLFLIFTLLAVFAIRLPIIKLNKALKASGVPAEQTSKR